MDLLSYICCSQSQLRISQDLVPGPYNKSLTPYKTQSKVHLSVSCFDVFMQRLNLALQNKNDHRIFAIPCPPKGLPYSAENTVIHPDLKEFVLINIWLSSAGDSTPM